jgi:two-component system chemotaxis sensor kinase CheA
LVKIDLVIKGQDTEMDRTVIEEIGDPLIHLIRNAVDHGIESAEERVRLGKSERGTIAINAAYEENQVVILIEDDGSGIDPEKIKASAVRKAIITVEES